LTLRITLTETLCCIDALEVTLNGRQRRATIVHVAKLAGVSVTTVSNVLNNRGDAMSPATRLRVLEASRSLDYHPSASARSLASRQTATIGLVIAEIATPLFFRAVSVVERVARHSNYNLLLCHASTGQEEQDALDLLQEKDVEGIILLSTSDLRDDGILARLSDSVPVVTVNRSGAGGAFDRIEWDNVGGVAAAVRHLYGLGHRRIAFLRGPSDRQGTEERLQGYRFGLAECGLAFTNDYVAAGDYYSAGPAEWREAVEQLLSRAIRPTSVIASDDSVAAVVMRTVQEKGLRVPEDVALVGIDDQPFAALLNPALTTVRLPILDAGQQAITLLVERIRDRTREPSRLVLPTELVVRESSGSIRQAHDGN
jgi:LacI family transcriptional regulator